MSLAGHSSVITPQLTVKVQQAHAAMPPAAVEITTRLLKKVITAHYNIDIPSLAPGSQDED